MTEEQKITPAEDDDSAAQGLPGDDIAEGGESSPQSGRRRQSRTFPAMSFSEALAWPVAVLNHGAGKPIRRLTLLETLQKSPTSSATRQLITASNQYGLTVGGYNAENVEITRKGRLSVDPSVARSAQLTARYDLSVDAIAPFKALFDLYAGSRLPAVGVLRDAARDSSVAEEHVAECVETFLANVRDLGLIANIAGTEHLLRLADLIERAGDDRGSQAETAGAQIEQARAQEATGRGTSAHPTQPTDGSFDEICFVVSPIGDPGSEARKHADLVLNYLIAPAIEELGLHAVRADNISKPGMITNQVMEHLVRSRLVIADLSFANPNVYYELAVRHAARRPAVQLTRSVDRLPFDVGQFRTVVMDMADICTLIPQLELHRAEITRQARVAIDHAAEAESPISRFYPGFWDET